MTGIPIAECGIVGSHEGDRFVTLFLEELDNALDKNLAIAESFKFWVHDQVFQFVLEHDGEPENAAGVLNANGGAKVAPVPEIHKGLEVVAREAAGHQIAGVGEIKIHESTDRQAVANDGDGHCRKGREEREEKLGKWAAAGTNRQIYGSKGFQFFTTNQTSLPPSKNRMNETCIVILW